MRFIALSILAALATLAYAHFDGQVIAVLATMNGDEEYTFGTAPGDLVIEGDDGAVSTTGVITNDSATSIQIITADTFLISDDVNIETHFQFDLQFESTKSDATPIGPLGSNEDPMYGCMAAGVQAKFGCPTFYFLLTDSKAYAVAEYSANATKLTWAVPVCSIDALKTRTYTVALRPDIGRVMYRINNVNMVEIPGYCGIDNRFLISGTSTGCSPTYLDNFITEAVAFVYQGRYWKSTSSTGFCQRAQYEMCEENVSFAPGCRCQYQSAFVDAPFAYTGLLSSLQVFVMERTNRCDNESSSSEYVPWWRCRPDCCGPKPTTTTTTTDITTTSTGEPAPTPT